MRLSNITYSWREPFTNHEIHQLHAAAFDTRLFDESEWDWVDQTERHSLGWVVGRDGDRFVGFVHAARDGAAAAGCEFLHVGFDEDLASFYIDACGFLPTRGGLMELT